LRLVEAVGAPLAEQSRLAYQAPDFGGAGREMPLLVMKFGGTSVATLDRIRRAAKRVGREVANGYDVIVIVSAMSGETNKLVGWVKETSPSMTPANTTRWCRRART
jgi:aspartokinase